MKRIVITVLVLIAIHPVAGQADQPDRKDARRETFFEEALRWKLSTGDPSGDTQIEVSGSQVRITLTGNKCWNEATASFDAKYFGLLCLLWDTEGREEDQRGYILRDWFEVTLIQEPEKVVTKVLVYRTDFPTIADLNTAILLTKSQVRDILMGQAVQANAHR
jgi:hypothetical protein